MLMVDENIGKAMTEAAKLYSLRFENISFMSEMIVFVYSFLGKLLKSFYKSRFSTHSLIATQSCLLKYANKMIYDMCCCCNMMAEIKQQKCRSFVNWTKNTSQNRKWKSEIDGTSPTLTMKIFLTCSSL